MGELVQKYLTRFDIAATAIQDAVEKFILMVLCNGVHPKTKFARRLIEYSTL